MGPLAANAVRVNSPRLELVIDHVGKEGKGHRHFLSIPAIVHRVKPLSYFPCIALALIAISYPLNPTDLPTSWQSPTPPTAEY